MRSGNISETKKSGGLYRNVKVSVKTVNYVIVIGIIALLASIIFLVSHNGFTVKYDTDGGSHTVSDRVLYGEKLNEPDTPVKEGYAFTGWYLDRAGTAEWDMQKDTVSESITLYAGWEKN